MLNPQWQSADLCLETLSLDAGACLKYIRVGLSVIRLQQHAHNSLPLVRC